MDVKTILYPKADLESMTHTTGIIVIGLTIEECAALIDVPIPQGQGAQHRKMALLKLKAAIMATPE